MGVLRFVPELKEIAGARFGRIPYFHMMASSAAWTIRAACMSIDASRYYPRSRTRYGCTLDSRIYLCMESPDVWEEALGIRMESDQDLAAYLNAAVS